MRRLILAAAAVASLAGCPDMTPTQQRALSGTAIGAGGGAIIGAIAGNAGFGAGIGAAAGLAPSEAGSGVLVSGGSSSRKPAPAAEPATIGCHPPAQPRSGAY
jgi:hypothetical protein